MRKITLLLSVLALILFSACNDKNAYTIQGSYADAEWNGKTVYLQTADTTDKLDPVILDSAVIKDGKFELKGKLTESPIIGIVSIGKLSERSKNMEDLTPVGTLVLEEGAIKIDFNKTLVTLSGTPKNEQMNKIHVVLNEVSNTYMQAAKESSAGGITSATQTKMDELQKEIQTKGFAFTKENIKNRLGEVLFFTWMNLFTKDQLIELIESSNSSFKNRPNVQQLKSNLSIVVPEVGKPFADVQLEDKDGKKIALSSLVGKDKVVLIDFWASWCGPCVEEMPNVVKAYQKYKAKGFDIVGISEDQEKEAWTKAIKNLNMTWVQLIDNGTAAQAYAVNSIPSTFLVDKSGIVIATNLRGNELEKKLEEVLK